MPLTVAGMEAEITTALGWKWVIAGLPAATVDGTNAYLAPAIRKGLRYVGIYPASPLAVVDSDLSAIPASRAEQYNDSCILEALYILRGQMPNAFDQQIEAESQKLHQIMDDLNVMIADYQRRVPKTNLPPMAVGKIRTADRIPNPIRRDRVNWYGMGEF